MALFKAPSWAKQKTAAPKDENEEERDIFSHADSFMSIREDQIAHEKARAEKAKEKEQRLKEKQKAKEQRRSKKRNSEEAAEKDDVKKRRITAEDGAKLLAKAGISNVIDIDGDSDEAGPAPQSEEPARRSPRNQRTKDLYSPRKSKSNLSRPVEVARQPDDDIEVTAIVSRPASLPAPTQPDDEEVESDPEFAEMQRQGRAKAQLGNQQQHQSKATPDIANSPNGESAQLPTPPQHDPAVQILITSSLPNTKPLIVYRKLSQALQPVKEAWVKRQEFADDVASSIFLTFRGRQLWSSTTVRRLGLESDSYGNVYSVDDPSRAGVEKVAVEAVTPELFEEMKANKERQSKIAMGELEPEPAQGNQEPEEEAAAQTKDIRLVIKAKNKPEWRVKVNPTTRVSKILKAAKKNLQIPPEQPAYLEFDGERLEPEDEVGDTELEDMFGVDLHLGN